MISYRYRLSFEDMIGSRQSFPPDNISLLYSLSLSLSLSLPLSLRTIFKFCANYVTFQWKGLTSNLNSLGFLDLWYIVFIRKKKIQKILRYSKMRTIRIYLSWLGMNFIYVLNKIIFPKVFFLGMPYFLHFNFGQTYAYTETYKSHGKISKCCVQKISNLIYFPLF